MLFSTSKKFLATVIVLTVIQHVSAQDKDYVVTVKGDTLTGDVKLLHYDELIDRVQITREGKKSLYTALQVKTVYSKSDTYHSVKQNNAYRFMKSVKSGFLSLYAFKLANQSSFDGLFLVKKNGQSMEVPNLGFKKSMSKFLEDCEEVATALKDESLKHKDLNAIIDQYNACLQPGTKPTSTQATISNEQAGKMLAVENLQKKVEALESLPSRKDAIDLLRDIHDKLKNQQSIPNYQAEALKTYLNNQDSLKEDLDKVLAAIKVQ